MDGALAFGGEGVLGSAIQKTVEKAMKQDNKLGDDPLEDNWGNSQILQPLGLHCDDGDNECKQ